MLKIIDGILSIILVIAIVVGILTFMDANRISKEIYTSNPISRTIKLEVVRYEYRNTDILDNPYSFLTYWWVVNVLGPMYE